MRKKKVPMRMCVGCQVMFPKRDLLRIVHNKEGEVSVDLIGKKPGRGAYICKKIECFEKAQRAKRFDRVFEANISEELLNYVRVQLEEFDVK